MSRVAAFQPAAVTGHVSSPNAGILLRKCSCGGTCDKCKETEERSLHRKASGASPSHEAPSIVHDVLRNQGQALDAGTRADMEQRFGHDFASVRVHTGARAAESADAVQAHAYTVGQHVVFGANRFAPATTDGRQLLAHELAHTVQQRGNGEQLQHRLIVRDNDSPDERAADRAADVALRGASGAQPMPAIAAGVQPGGVQRKGAVLLPPEKVNEIYVKWIGEYLKARGTNVMDNALEKEVRERVKKQVGPGNFANFERWEEAEDEKRWAKAQAENPKPKEPEKSFDLVSAQNADYQEMWRATESLRMEVVRVEKLAKKLDFGTGAKGELARYTAARYTEFYGVGGRTLTSVSEHAPAMLLGAAGTALGSEMAEEYLVKQGQEVKKEGEEMGADLRTAGRLESGELQAIYDSTRPLYKKYMAAFKTFSDNSSDFINKNQDLEGVSLGIARAPYIAGMKAAMKDMRETGNEFLMACAKLGIENDAAALGKMGENVVKGAEGTVETAVMGALTEVAPGLGELKNAIKGVKGMGVKQLEKEGLKQLEKIGEKELEKQAAKQLEKGGVKQLEKEGARQLEKEGARQLEKEGVKELEKTGAKQVEKEAAVGGAEKAGVESGAKPTEPAAPTKTKGPPKKLPEADAVELRKAASKQKPVTDQALLEQGYTREVQAGEHTYRRKADGTWCRFTTVECNFKVDPEIDKMIDDAIRAEPTPQGPAKRVRPEKVPPQGNTEAAREAFDDVRDGYAKKLGVKSGEDVHHAIELQVLDRYPDAFKESELNAFQNMRGIPAEVKMTKQLEDEIAKRGLKPGTDEYAKFVEPYLGKKQLHNSKIRDVWDRHYARLDEEIAKRGLKRGTDAYRQYVRQYLETARKEIDYLYESFFTEVKRGKQPWKGAAR